MVYEIRSYHFEPTRLAEYKKWAHELAVPYLEEQLDLVGFWTNRDEEPEVLGEPHDSLGTANVTWIIRWEDLDQRDPRMREVFVCDAWREIFAKVPGGRASYLRRESKFAEAHTS